MWCQCKDIRYPGSFVLCLFVLLLCCVTTKRSYLANFSLLFQERCLLDELACTKVYKKEPLGVLHACTAWISYSSSLNIYQHISRSSKKKKKRYYKKTHCIFWIKCAEILTGNEDAMIFCLSKMSSEITLLLFSVWELPHSKQQVKYTSINFIKYPESTHRDLVPMHP